MLEDNVKRYLTHQERRTGKIVGNILIYLKIDVKFKTIKYLSVSDGYNECVTVEIEKKNSKNVSITCFCRHPSGAIIGLNSFLENVLKKANTKTKLSLVAGDFNLNCLDYNKNLELRTCIIEFLYMVALF